MLIFTNSVESCHRIYRLLELYVNDCGVEVAHEEGASTVGNPGEGGGVAGGRAAGEGDEEEEEEEEEGEGGAAPGHRGRKGGDLGYLRGAFAEMSSALRQEKRNEIVARMVSLRAM